MPRYSKKKNTNCEVCNKPLSDRTAQRRHHQAFHPEYLDKTTRKLLESFAFTEPSIRPRQSDRLKDLAANIEKKEALKEKIRNGTENGIEVRAVEGKGYGVLSQRVFDKGEFICEYVGDLVDKKEADKREKEYEREEKGCYMLYFKFNEVKLCVDATDDNGRKGRFFNHSKKAFNVSVKLIPIDGYPHIVLVAARKINPGEELVYDYGDRSKESLEDNEWLAL